MTLSKRQLSKRKRTSNSTSDGEGTHPSSKRNAPPGDSSPPDSIESPSNSAPDPSSNRGKKRRRELTLPDKIIERIMSFLCIVPRVSESGGYRAAPKGYNITEFMKKMVLLCAERRLERARQRKKIDFGLEETVSRTLDWMRRLTHQHHYLDTECRNGGPSDFRERLQWADFNVTLAVEQLEREAEVKAKKQKALEKARGKASQSRKQQSSQEATLSPDEKEHTKQTAAEEATQSRSIPEQTTAHTNGPALNASNISYTAVRPTSDQYTGQLQRTSMLGHSQDREAAPTPSLPSAPHTILPSCHELRASIDARRRSLCAARRAQLAYRGPSPSSSPLTLDAPVSPHASAASLLSTTPPHDQFALRTLPPPAPLAPESPPPVSPAPQSFTTTKHRGPTDFRPSGPANPFAPVVQQRDTSPPPLSRRHERRGAIWQLPTLSCLSQRVQVPGATATAHEMQNVDPALAPAPSRRVARYRAQIAAQIEAHVNGTSTLRDVVTSPRRWFGERSVERREDEARGL